MSESVDRKNVDFQDSKLRAAYALNLCTVSISQIIDYDDIVILEQEYEDILNNLNLEMMPKDEALLNILKQLLDTITFFRIQEVEKSFVDREYQNKMKNAIWSAVPNIGILFAGGVSSFVFSLASQIGIGYMNYRKTKAELSFEYERNKWGLHKAAIEQFNGLRRELFDTAWRLVDAHQIPDEYRLTERQVKQYNEILMDPDVYRRYKRLTTIKDKFIAYPPFWYFYGNTENALSQISNSESRAKLVRSAKSSFEKFIQGFQACNLLRENSVAASCALEYIDLLDPSLPEEKRKIEQLIDFAIKMSGNANDVLQLCAFAYLRVNDMQHAAELFERLVNENYNQIVNAQLLSGYYVSQYLSGEKIAESRYNYLKRRIDVEYLFPFPETKLLQNPEGTKETLQIRFVKNQKEILSKKFGIILNLFQEKSRIAFNKCIPVPEGKKYSDGYFNDSLLSYDARKMDGIPLRNKGTLSNYREDILECDYPYNYLPVLNDMLNSLSDLICLQGHEAELIETVSSSIVKNRQTLLQLREKIEDSSKFTQEVYNELLEVKFDDFTGECFNLIAHYSGEYIELKNDIIAMNEAEMNLREFCQQQGFEAPEILYDTANDIVEEQLQKKQYLGIELIEEGISSSIVNDRFDEVRKIILKYIHNICMEDGVFKTLMAGTEEFERYFIRLDIPNKRDVRRKSVVVIDDRSNSDNDLVFTTDGVMQIIRGKMKETVLYDKISLTPDHNAIVLHQNYSHNNLNMHDLIKMIEELRTTPFAEVKEIKNPIDFIVNLLNR